MTGENFLAGPPNKTVETVMSYQAKWSFSSGSGTFNAISQALWRNYIAWNNCLFTPDSYDSSLGSDGDVGEFVKVAINEARTVGKQYISLITRQKLYWEAITDVDSASPIQDMRLAKGIANAVTEKQNLQNKMYNMVEKTYIYGASFISAIWQTDKGYPYAMDENNNIQYSGDVTIDMHDISDVIYDWSIESWDVTPWVAFRRMVNKYDIAAQHPDLADQIMTVCSARSDKRLIPRFNMLSSFDNPDIIYVWEFYSRPSPAMPQGRMIIYVNPAIILYDDVNKYGTLPIEPLMFSKIQGTGLGYPELCTALPAQEILDGIVSTIASNARAFGSQSVLMPSGSDIDPTQIADGMLTIRYTPLPQVQNGGKPEILDLLKIPDSLFKFNEMMTEKVGDLSGLSNTIRGNPPSGITSGNALATLTANASEFLTQAQAEYSMCVQKLMNHVINAYRLFATVQQTSKIIGTSSIGYVANWKGEDLKSIQLVKLRQSNSVLDSVAGRQQIADNLLQAQQINGAQYIQLQSGVPLESIFEDTMSEVLAIKTEIDAIIEGKQVAPLITDNHPLFIDAYQKLLYNPYVRVNSTLTQSVLQLMQTRVQLELQFQQNFALYQMVRGQPSPAIPPPPPGAGPNQPPPSQQSPQKGIPDNLPQGVPSAPAKPAKPEAKL